MEASDVSAAVLGERAAVCGEHGEYTARGNAFTVYGKRREHWTGCPRCAERTNATETHAKRAEEERARQARIEDRLNRAGIPKRFRSRRLDNFVVECAAQEQALATAREFVEHFAEHADRGTTMVFSGNVGTGKGHLALAVAQAVIAGGRTAFYATARELVLMLRQGWSDKSAPSEIEVLRMLSSVGLLVIDEVGVQFGSDAERDQLFAVIDGRYRECMPTIFTTNLRKQALRDALGERSFDRIREGGKWVAFDWQTYRGRAA